MAGHPSVRRYGHWLALLPTLPGAVGSAGLDVVAPGAMRSPAFGEFDVLLEYVPAGDIAAADGDTGLADALPFDVAPEEASACFSRSACASVTL